MRPLYSVTTPLIRNLRSRLEASSDEVSSDDEEAGPGDVEVPSADALAAEVERFLREQDRGSS